MDVPVKTENKNKPSPYWRYSETLTARDAIFLLLDEEPTKHLRIEDGDDEIWMLPDGFLAIRNAIMGALASGAIVGELVPKSTWVDSCNEVDVPNTINLIRSVVNVASFKYWCLSMGHRGGYFFPDSDSGTPEYLNPLNKNYSQHLAYAIQAWEAMQIDGAIQRGKTPKNTMIEWLEQFELSVEAKERIATVVNWKKGGSA